MNGRNVLRVVCRVASTIAAIWSALEDATHWSARTLARAQGVNHSTVFRIWQSWGLQPHRVEGMLDRTTSSDPKSI
jgi:hypothetical protein